MKKKKTKREYTNFIRTLEYYTLTDLKKMAEANKTNKETKYHEN